jgi:hypothetical protein
VITLRAKIEAAIVLAILVGGVLAFRTWLSEHDLRVHAEEHTKAQEQVIAAIDEREKQREQILKDALAQIAASKAAVQTPQQVIHEIPQYLPPLPTPIRVTTPAPTADNPKPKPVVTIPPEDLKPLYDFAADCKACALKYADAQKTIADDQAKLKGKDDEVETWKAAAKGGTKWQRFTRAAKWIAIGVVSGYVAAKAHR